MWTTDDNHGAQVQFHSGKHRLDPPGPTIGAWVNYGLGTLNENLPQFISMGPRFFDKKDGHYLGPAYDAVKLKIDPKNPLDFAKPEAGGISPEEQRLGFGLVNRLNHLNLATLSERRGSGRKDQVLRIGLSNADCRTRGHQFRYGI